VRIGVYLGCALGALAAGALCARALATRVIGDSGVAFAVVGVSALAIGLAGSVVEERALWRGRLSRRREAPGWIGEPRSQLLASAAPPPLSLGFALGLLSRFLA